jgi:hypothetical protein
MIRTCRIGSAGEIHGASAARTRSSNRITPTTMIESGTLRVRLRRDGRALSGSTVIGRT